LGVAVVLHLGFGDGNCGLDAPLEIGSSAVEAVALANQSDLGCMSLWARHRHVSMHMQLSEEGELEGANELLAVHGEGQCRLLWLLSI